MHGMTIDVKYGVPTVSIHTDKFHPVTKSVARVNGTPNFRQVYVPQPVMGKSDRELRAYIDGNDPITGQPVMQEVIEGLTKPLDQEDQKGLTFERSTPRLVEAWMNLLSPMQMPEWVMKLLVLYDLMKKTRSPFCSFP